MLFHIIYDLFTVNMKGKDFNRSPLGPISYCVLINCGIKNYLCRQLSLVPYSWKDRQQSIYITASQVSIANIPCEEFWQS